MTSLETSCLTVQHSGADRAGPHLPVSRLPFSPRFEAIHHELNKATAQNKDLQWEMELLQSELTELRTTQVKTAKESEKYKEERDAVYSEYKLIMSERDQVISELDKLQTEVELAESKLKSSTSEKAAASEEMEVLRQVGSWAAGLPALGKPRGGKGCRALGVQNSSVLLSRSEELLILCLLADWVISHCPGNC